MLGIPKFPKFPKMIKSKWKKKACMMENSRQKHDEMNVIFLHCSV